ncbi:peptidase YpeB-like protein [Streptomyces sp. BK208]|uniref:PepSY domain-containing protein n=1 Tax=Streptomyces sp. BK208 TaxID=2512150 RepID=UPI001061A5A7|nr:PepSY domain-containing protein [Streptomyces sp. BK208]TDT38411.1 peptidase YpeB-like protein [Streptomyces sp. BK208]
MKRNIVIAAVTAAALIGGGTATALATTADDDRREASEDSGAAAAKVTAAGAVASALADTPGTAVAAELDDGDDASDDDDGDDGGRERAAWEVDVLSGGGTWHSVRVDPATGKVLGSERDDDEDETAEVRAALKGTSVDAAEAAKAAARHGTVLSVELDEDGHHGDGKPAWEVETRAAGKDGQDWRVDPGTGKVTADRAQDAQGSQDPDDADDADDSGTSDDD